METPTASQKSPRLATPPTDLPGWGIDADPENDPTYPMKPHRTDAEQTGYSWERPTQQPADVEILKTVERPNLTAVFGTSTPPSGVSGMIRRYAYTYSENDARHWMTLVLADKVNVVEGVIADLTSGHVPNIFKEKGYKASWQYDRKGLLVSLGTTLAITAGLVYLAYPKGKKNSDKLKGRVATAADSHYSRR